MSEKHSIEEKKEMLISNYDLCYDLQIAKVKTPSLTDEEFKEILEDEYFIARIGIIDSEVKEGIMLNLLDLSKSQNENIKLKATLELGKVLYANKFDKKNKSVDDTENKKMPTIYLEGEYPENKND